jgi:hypothetical protein
MIVYVVYDTDDEYKSVNSIYDEETFKKEYKKFLTTQRGLYWDKYYWVVKMKINKDSEHNEYMAVDPDEMK